MYVQYGVVFLPVWSRVVYGTEPFFLQSADGKQAQLPLPPVSSSYATQLLIPNAHKNDGVGAERKTIDPGVFFK